MERFAARVRCPRSLNSRAAIAIVLCALPAAAMSPCSRPLETAVAAPGPSAAHLSPPGAPAEALPRDRFTLANRFAYIPPQCYAKTRAGDDGPARNPCYACHVRSEPPNAVDDADLQLTLSLPVAAAINPWTNLFDPPAASGPRPSDDDVLAYVRQNNHVDQDDARFVFDERGFDRRPDGTFTGWRAFAYYPLPGAFFPTNGSTDDVLIRLDPSLQEDAEGHFDPAIYAINLAIVEGLVTRRDVPIDATDERPLGVDLDRNGVLGRATHVTFGKGTRYVGRAGSTLAAGPGLFPLNTEFLHSVRYLDVGPDGAVRMAARMKELRYAKKVRWLADVDLARIVERENAEQSTTPDGVAYFVPRGDEGVYNGVGWLFRGFIEAADGSLRPQSYEETVACVGCHGGIGATTDSIFSMPRKLPATSPARGWSHWSQRGLAGIPEPRRRDGRYEYTLYLEENRGGDDLHENTEVLERFFDDRGQLRAGAITHLHADIGTLLLPSPARALELDRAYMAIVGKQSYVRGRDAVLAPTVHAYTRAPVGERTGIERTVENR
jgi:hypothetical protein